VTDRIHSALVDIAAMATDAQRDYPTVRHWIDYQRANHIKGTDYDRDGGSSGDVTDLSVKVLRPDPGTRYARRLEKAVRAAHSALIEIDAIRRANLTTVSLKPLDGDEAPCAHCGQEPRYRGDLGRRCYDWKRAHAGALPGPEVLEAWRRGKQPKVRVG
jgi:hypothetical protein